MKKMMLPNVVLMLGMIVAGCGQTVPISSDNTAALAGQEKFNASCGGCHTARSLVSSANQIVKNLGTLGSAMNSITLTDQEVSDLKAFLATQ